MRKGAARNMQRLSLKMEVGTAPPQYRDVHQAPVYRQVRALELRRLARVRYSFEIEQEIAEKLAAGDSVGLLREKLLGVRNGTIEPPHYRDIRPTGDPMRLREKKLDWAAEQRKHENRRAPPEKRLYRSERELEADLADLAKGKLTPTGIGTIKGMLERFDEELVIAVLGLTREFIRKVAASAVYRLAPDLSPKDGLLLSEVLQSRLPLDEETDRGSAPAAVVVEASVPPSKKPATAPTSPTVGAISVDDISGAEFLSLRGKGWSIKGAWMYPPGAEPSASQPAARPAKKAAVAPPVRARVAVSPEAPKRAKAAKKAKKGKKDPAAKGRRHVPLSPEALERLRSNEAFRTTPMATPRKRGTLALSDRPGFVSPPASPEINWRDESEDGAMWDR
jgi:hypothetical protein